MDAKLTNRLVLLVEDERSLLDGMQAWLRDNNAGFAVMGATDGVQALELIERHRPDLVVTDVRMPNLDGLGLLQASRRKYPDVRFILMSAYGTKELVESSKRHGAVLFLRKPLDMTVLESTIVDALRQPIKEPRDGFLRGISVPGFVQLLNMERQTLTLILKRPGGASGELYFRDGEVVHAVYEEISGEQAALTLLSWEEAEMFIRRGYEAETRSIHKSMNFLIMEAARTKDEAGKKGV